MECATRNAFYIATTKDKKGQPLRWLTGISRIREATTLSVANNLARWLDHRKEELSQNRNFRRGEMIGIRHKKYVYIATTKDKKGQPLRWLTGISRIQEATALFVANNLARWLDHRKEELSQNRNFRPGEIYVMRHEKNVLHRDNEG
ncbi:hypothetical protein [Erwinia sp. JUb26]|uniref:hypothetical protein n=1 Tax=Erwinia sp. JUb26 TaxID=2485126 RepID=UPI000F4803CA|nr:hypothetical protein [Erwinia sp. JUb26]ROR11400.1 hypothetical protein EC836_103320 [Erwinia sp. JUb26]